MAYCKYKVFLFLIIMLAIIGMALSVYLTISFYHPEITGKFIACGDGVTDNCSLVSQSEYSSVLGIPLSSFSLLFYIFLFFILLIAAYADGQYYVYGWAVIFPLSAASLVIDGILAGILVKLGTLCLLCISSYIINILIFICLLFYLQDIKKAFSVSFKGVFLLTFKTESQNHDKRAVIGLFLLFSVMLLLNVVTPELNLKKETHEGKIKASLNDFYASEPVDIEFPESSMMTGNPNAPVKLIVFTDFFCNACYQFYLAEKYLLSKYKNKIKVVYYNYPRGGSCSGEDGKKILRRSCIAAKAFLSAGYYNIFAPYLTAHYHSYQYLYKDYDESKAIGIISEIMDDQVFLENMNSPETAELLERDLKLVHQLNMKVTPTVFINGRALLGVPPYELFDAIIEKELKKDKKNDEF
ncbi:vitamin K epoxide reductase family protein [Desulfonema magnum]|uniref:Thioredoxin-like fold-containing protein n=1 Tax=Desulfonema magnum TaxID=45655 RepID=A0A975BWT0_9BACT|nr:thioredoxin domain-containing protein [Desulfonema magnum]QTA92763.1 Thioredoxin-like fold-containing protein [Desulfonema magnum]